MREASSSSPAESRRIASKVRETRKRRGDVSKGPNFRERQAGNAGAENLYGVHCCAEALRARRRSLSALLLRPGAEKRPEVAEIIELSKSLGLPIRPLESRESGSVSGANPQGVGLVVGPLPEVAIESLAISSPNPRRLLVLDGVEDPQNVGALARVAEGAGIRGMILSRRRAPPLSSALARASAGAIEWLPVCRVTNIPRAIKYLKSEGFWVVGADLTATDSLYRVPDKVLRGDLVVVMGAEGRGLRPEVLKLVDHPVRIEMMGEVASLNVSAAGAVLLYELLRRAENPVDGS
jgi:23S rRNA (guanosine2251-2'-O)-methyltransferase